MTYTVLRSKAPLYCPDEHGSPSQGQAQEMKPQSYLGAALVILAKVGQPMTSRELTEEALRQSLIKPAGKTPLQTMAASLYTEINRNPNTRLVRLAKEGPTRAQRGSVRWALRDNTTDRDE
jgi:hypothetical protein